MVRREGKEKCYSAALTKKKKKILPTTIIRENGSYIWYTATFSKQEANNMFFILKIKKYTTTNIWDRILSFCCFYVLPICVNRYTICV